MKPNPLFNLNLKKDKNALEKGCEWAKELGENKRHKQQNTFVVLRKKGRNDGN